MTVLQERNFISIRSPVIVQFCALRLQMDHICGENFVSLICSQTVFTAKADSGLVLFFVQFSLYNLDARAALHLES